MSFVDSVRRMPVVSRCFVIGLVTFGIAGGLVGLVLGLRTYVPTAWFAIFELGVPSAIAGGAVGAGLGCTVGAVHRLRRSRPER